MAEWQFLVLLISYAVLQSTFPYAMLGQNPFVGLILPVIFLLFIHRLIKRHFCGKKINPVNKAVVITGCDSGFGNRLARRLDSLGFHVFASCLFPEGSGASDLKKTCSDRLKVVALDVASDESVSDALEFVKDNLGPNVLWAVVNNAGIAKGSAVDFSTMEHFRDTIEVNALGPVRVSKAFLPLLKESRGRVVNVNSLMGRTPFPNICPYAMSKHAAVVFTECLSLEMLPWGVRVISIEPETFSTPIVNTVPNRLKTERAEIDETILSSYGEEYFEQLEKYADETLKFVSSSNIDIVVDDMESAVTELHPDHVYKPRWSWLTKVLCDAFENTPISIKRWSFLVFIKFFRYPTPCSAKTL